MQFSPSYLQNSMCDESLPEKNKKIGKSSKTNKSKQTMKQIKRQRERNRRANHKQYVTELENQLMVSQNKIGVLEERVKELEYTIQNNINRKNTEQGLYCARCQLVIQEENHLEGMEDDDPAYFFREESPVGFRLGTRSQCILVMTILCLIASAIAHNPHQNSTVTAFSTDFCSSSFTQFLSSKAQILKSLLQEHLELYKNLQNCKTPLLYQKISKVSQQNWFLHTNFLSSFLQSVYQKLIELMSLPKLELLEKIAAFVSQIPSEKNIFLMNLVRDHQGY